MSLGAWMASRKKTLVSIAIGTVTWPIAFGAGWAMWPAGPVLDAPGDRLAYAAQHLAAIGALVLLMVSACFRVFDTADAENPMAGAESERWRVHQRVLQNTVEQSLIFIPALLALAVRLDPRDMRVLSVLTATWCAGRLLFWIGYRIHWMFRGPGFEWTLFTSILTLVWFASTL